MPSHTRSPELVPGVVAAARLSCGYVTLHRLLAEGLLKGERRGARVFVTEDSLARAIERRNAPTASVPA